MQIDELDYGDIKSIIKIFDGGTEAFRLVSWRTDVALICMDVVGVRGWTMGDEVIRRFQFDTLGTSPTMEKIREIPALPDNIYVGFGCSVEIRVEPGFNTVRNLNGA